jgi:hypothetical protein
MPQEIANLFGFFNQKVGSVNVNLRKGYQVCSGTINVTGNEDEYHVVQEAGILDSIDFSGNDNLAASDSNFITFSVLNLGQVGVGTTQMLAPTDANTTKLTGGSPLVAHGRRSLVMHGTISNRYVQAGDRLRVRAAVTGTLANTVGFPTYMVRFRGQG